MKIEITHGESFRKIIPITRLSKDGEEGKMSQVEGRLNIYKEDKLEYTSNIEREDDNFIIDLSEEDILMFEPGEYKAEIEILHGRKKQKQKLDLVIEADQEVDFFDSEENVNKDKEMKLYFQEPIDVAIDSFFSDRENVEKFIAPFIPIVEDGYTPQKGVDYDDGYTPIKGKDYKDGVDGVTPVKGKDYFTNKELLEIKKALKDTILSEMPEHATKDELNLKFDEILKKIPKESRIEKGATFLRQLLDVKVGNPTATQYGLTYNPSTSEFTLTEITGGGGGGSVDSVVAGTGITVDATDPANPIVATTITQYTDELAQDAVGTIMTDSAEIDFTYNDGTPSITASIVAGSIDESKLDTSVNASLDLADTAVQPAGLSGYELLSNKATDFTTVNNTLYPTVQAVNTAINTAVTGLLDYRGSYDASANLFPATGGSGILGAILSGDFWICSVAGTLGGTPVTLGDLIIAIVDTPGQTAGNWDLIENTLGYTPENVANKENTTIDTNTTKYPTVNLLKTGLDTKQATLVSGTNIKTVNSTTLLGSGDLAVATTAQGALADSALQPGDIASGTITARADDINFSGGIDGDVLTVQADGSLALETLGGGSGTVTSVAISGSDGLEVDSGSPITTSGTIALGVNKTALLAHINVEDGADVTDATNVNAAGAVMNSDYTPAHSILVQQSGTGSPTIVQIPNSTIVGRIAGGGSDIDALTASEVRTIINVEDGADVTDATNVAAAGAFMKSVDDTDDITDTATNRFTDDTAITRLANTSGTNTGDQTITNSSDATSHTVTLSASGGSVQLIEGSGITLTTGGTASAGTVTIAASGGSGATTALDNLAAVAINTSLVSDTDNTDDLGTTLKKWANLFVTTIGATATRVTKGWFTDLEVTNAIAGSITGNAATVTTNANLTGPVTSVGNATAIANGAISNAMLANGAVANLSGTNTGDQTSVSGNAGTATALATPRAIYGNNFDGSAALTQVIASTYGGTGNGFTKISGPTTTEKTITIPDANMTITAAAATVLDDTTVGAMVDTLGGATSTGTGGLVRATAPQISTIELGHATDTTLSRVSAGVVAVEGVNLVKAGAATSSGLTMATSRILGRTTASTGAIEEITVGTGLSLSAGTLSASGGGGAWVLKSYSTASDVNSITVSSLDMATNNGRYKIIVEYDTTTGPENTIIYSDINGVTTASSYLAVWNGRTFDDSAGTTADASGGAKSSRWEFGSGAYYCGSIVMELSIHDVNGNATKDYIGGIFHSFGLGNGSDTDNLNTITGSLSQRTQTNVTSIKFHNSTGDPKNWKVWVMYPAIA